jgi:hypothetical protein
MSWWQWGQECFMLWCTLCTCTCSWWFSANPLQHTYREFLLPVNGSLPADELVAVGAGVLHALVDALHVHLQLVVQRESSTAHIQRISLTCERKFSCR